MWQVWGASGKRVPSLKRDAWKNGSHPSSFCQERVWNSRGIFWWLGEVTEWTGRSWEVERTDVLMISCGSEINHPEIILPWTFCCMHGGGERTGEWTYSAIYFINICSIIFIPESSAPVLQQASLGHDLSWHPSASVYPSNSNSWLASRESWKFSVCWSSPMLSILPGFLYCYLDEIGGEQSKKKNMLS